MGGETGVQSEVGVGSLFWFTARFSSVSRNEGVQPSAPDPIKGRRVLVVDDNLTNRKILMGQLLICGAEPVAAGSADEALTLMRQASAAGRPYDAALLDYLMPQCDGAELGRRIILDPAIKSTRLILLTSSGQHGDGQLFAQLGFAGYLLKPVTQRDLTACLVLVLANTAHSWHLRSQPIITRNALHAQRAHHGNRILLAEDNVVNQKVAVRLLEKMDYRVEVVPDGLTAVSAWQKGRFDLILMDCQMPHLDGYEATREIRRLEAGQRRIPIVALTANAMKSDEEKCRAAGMDDFVSKPIDRAKLYACLDRFLLEDVVAEASRPNEPSAAAGSPNPVDWSALIQSVGGDEAFARELAETFIAAGDRNLTTIAMAVETKDADTLRRTAHSIKGSSSAIRASAMTDAAAQLERAASTGTVEEHAELVENLKAEVSQAIAYLRSKV
jgi:CheY-like chemotaxis protein